jgi:nucleotidyltransferase/DNA polymerase involved in DNA repair
VVAVRYIKEALQKIEISKIRFCGGKVAEAFEAQGMTKVGEIQDKSLPELTSMLHGDESKAKWLSNIANGICFEDVAEKGPPTTATGIKTFNQTHEFS